MTTDDPAVREWDEATGRTRLHLAGVVKAHADLAERLAVMEKAYQGAVRLAAVRYENVAEAERLLRYALHLRMHGERAPGGDETWERFDRECEHYLRWGGRRPDPDPADALRLSPMTSYPPVQVPENTGKHPAESGDIDAIMDIADAHGEALREDWARRAVARAGESWATHMAKFDGTVLPR